MEKLIHHCCNPPLPCVPEAYNGKPAVFLDRDGTLIVEKHYLQDPDALLLFKDTIASLKQLQQAGLPLYIITNQAGIAHGFLTETILKRIHYELLHQLNHAGVNIAGIFYCPHHPAAELAPYRRDCFGRKPNPGLLFQAAARDQLDLTRSYVVGDKLLDISAGKAAGAKTVLVLTGYGATEQAGITEATRPDCIAASLSQAAQWITSEGLK